MGADTSEGTVRARERGGAGTQGRRSRLAQGRPAKTILAAIAVSLACSSAPQRLSAQATDTISLQFVGADLRAVVQGFSRHLDKPLISVGIPATPVTFETPRGVERRALPGLLRVLAEQHGLELSEDSVAWRLRPRPAEQVATLGQAPGQGELGPTQLFVIRLSHARAPDIAASINQLFGGGGEFSGRQGLSRSGLSEQLRQAPTAPGAPSPAAPNGPGGARGASLAGQVTIVPDEVTNSLLVRATQGDFEVVRNAVDQLDIRPLQVLIEVQIVEARTNHTFGLGNAVTLPPQPLGGGSVEATTTGGGLGDLVVRMMSIGGGDVNAVLKIGEQNGDVRILSRPVLIAANNTEATFMVGSQRAFPVSKRTLPNDNATTVQEFAYRDVGTRLTVLPTISHDGYVALEILQEINQATNELQLDSPVISTREAHTQVLVRDGQTIMIGGLRDQQRDRSSRGVPLLSRLPLIGGLFGSASRVESESELFLFLTPRVLRTDADVERATEARMPANAGGAP